MSFDQIGWAQIFKECGVAQSQIDQWAPIFAQVIGDDTFKYGTDELTSFLGQALHESGMLRILSESLNYSVEGLLATFGNGRISKEDAQKFGRTATQPANQQAIANIVYGGTWGMLNLGNKNPNDGWTYRGSGILQTTGAANFLKAEKRTDIPFSTNPDLMRTVGKPPLEAALAFWHENIGPAQLADPVLLRKKINGGQIGIVECETLTAKARTVIASMTPSN